MDTPQVIAHIVIDPQKRGGRPRIDETGITVHDIALDYNTGLTVDQIVEAFGLTPGQVHAALSYYFDHKEQIDQEILTAKIQDDQLREELIQQGKAMTAEEQLRRLRARKASQ